MENSEEVRAEAGSILLVDDTPENLRLLAGMLASHGFDARAVTSGTDALDAVAHEVPDLILLDVTMPGMSGFDVCARLKARPEWRDIPVIFLTALTDVSDKVKGFEAGGVDYITKPFQLDEVRVRVTTQLALRRARLDLERTIQKLRELERMRDNLTHMIVHDLRSPVTAIGGYLKLLSLGANQFTEDDQQSISAALEAVDWMTEMISSLLDVNRMESGELPLVKGSVDLNVVAAEALSTLGGLTVGRKVVHDTSAGPVFANCDRDIIRRVLSNLVGNALKFTPKTGTVTIAVRPDADGPVIEVLDTGYGIDEKYLSRVFDKFGQVEARSEHRMYSTGLGLTFCKLAVETHGGVIGVESKVNVGSRFYFRLPA